MKIAIITQEANPWVGFVLDQVKDTEVLVINQVSSNKRRPWMSRRFIKRRGLLKFADLILLEAWLLVPGRIKRIYPRGFGGPNCELESVIDEKHPANFAGRLSVLSRTMRNQSGMNWHDVRSINEDEAISLLKRFSPDVVILCGAPIIKKAVIDSCQVMLNPHCGIVPLYKGSAPAHWAILDNDWDNIGFTIHKVSPEVDAGSVIYRERVKIRKDWTIEDLDYYLVYSMYKKLSELICSADFPAKVATAVTQTDGRNWPPMGLLNRIRVKNMMKAYQEELRG